MSENQTPFSVENLGDNPKITLADKIKCVEREVMLRKKVYPKWVNDKKMTAGRAAIEILTMQAVLDDLRAKQAEDF